MFSPKLEQIDCVSARSYDDAAVERGGGKGEGEGTGGEDLRASKGLNFKIDFFLTLILKEPEKLFSEATYVRVFSNCLLSYEAKEFFIDGFA